MNNSDPMKNIYGKREDIIIIGLTGRTGSGCSTVANILKEEKTENLSLKDPKSFDYNNSEERKYNIVYKYMIDGNKWGRFDIIEMSSIILAMTFSEGKDKLLDFIDGFQKKQNNITFSIGDSDKLKEKFNDLSYMFSESKKHLLLPDDNRTPDDDLIEGLYNFYTKSIIKYKATIKDMLSEFSCYETKQTKLDGRKQTRYHLYTYLMQLFGNNIRASGNPYNSTFDEDKNNDMMKIIERIINVIIKFNNNKKAVTRICIDAIRNPFEAHYLRDTYRSFYLFSVNTEDEDRKNRLGYLSKEELDNLDKIEYPNEFKAAHEVYYHQNIQDCLEITDIHIYNPNILDNKYYKLTEQLLKYVSLMLHPGLITPTHIERCMQLAYNAKLNSGCLSRQVGAVVTRKDFSVISIGWNDVPKGHVSCNLRDVRSFCINKDKNSYSEYELYEEEFYEAMDMINKKIDKAYKSGRFYPYCFKDVYNSIKSSNNQVYTRSLHAEENAFIQVSKYGGTGVMDGNLFTTASPCELCAKKAYQLGIRNIYYIDPYPGISKKHILTFGEKNNPDMNLFYGAIGNAYISLYSSRMSNKDEMELLTDVNVKEVISIPKSKSQFKFDEIEITSSNIELVFETREQIVCKRDVEMLLKCDGVEHLDKYTTWTGSSYEKTVIIEPSEYKIIDSKEKSSPYKYTIKFDEKKSEGEKIHYKTETYVKDDKHVMIPYLGCFIANITKELCLKVTAKEDILSDVKVLIYADSSMETVFKEDICKVHKENGSEFITYFYLVKKPNIYYNYSVEWEFTEKHK